jgi:general secretion pathway protein H
MHVRRYTSGFTLIEILVVIVIVATVVSMALLSVGLIGEDADLDKERRRLASVIETIQDEAILQGREFGIELMNSAYRFVEFDPLTRQWNEVPGDDLYRLRELPEDLEFELYVDEKRIQLLNAPRQFDDPEKEEMSPGVETYQPHLFIFASGESSVYEIRLLRLQTDQTLILRSDVLGQLELLDEGEL